VSWYLQMTSFSNMFWSALVIIVSWNVSFLLVLTRKILFPGWKKMWEKRLFVCVCVCVCVKEDEGQWGMWIPGIPVWEREVNRDRWEREEHLRVRAAGFVPLTVPPSVCSVIRRTHALVCVCSFVYEECLCSPRATG